MTAASARCDASSVIKVGVANDPRQVYWAKPSGDAPASGFPAVVLFQGSFGPPAKTWGVDVSKSAPFGAYYQVALVAKLLEQGFVVIQPAAKNGAFWSTNVAINYATSADGAFVPSLFEALEGDVFGRVDLERLYATGLSSGGYMTSRMAVSYPGRFRALAIASAAYATCAGAACVVPRRLPASHPPTLFLHGVADAIVPISTARDYEKKLDASGIETRFVSNGWAGHQWLPSAPDEVVRWFLAH